MVQLQASLRESGVNSNNLVAIQLTKISALDPLSSCFDLIALVLTEVAQSLALFPIISGEGDEFFVGSLFHHFEISRSVFNKLIRLEYYR